MPLFTGVLAYQSPPSASVATGNTAGRCGTTILFRKMRSYETIILFRRPDAVTIVASYLIPQYVLSVRAL